MLPLSTNDGNKQQMLQSAYLPTASCWCYERVVNLGFNCFIQYLWNDIGRRVAFHMCSVRYNGQYIANKYHISSGQIWLSEVRCTGNETDFTQCRHNGWRRHNCDHSQDVAVSCSAADTDYAGNKFRWFWCSCVLCSVVISLTSVGIRTRPVERKGKIILAKTGIAN